MLMTNIYNILIKDGRGFLNDYIMRINPVKILIQDNFSSQIGQLLTFSGYVAEDNLFEQSEEGNVYDFGRLSGSCLISHASLRNLITA